MLLLAAHRSLQALKLHYKSVYYSIPSIPAFTAGTYYVGLHINEIKMRHIFLYATIAFYTSKLLSLKAIGVYGAWETSEKLVTFENMMFIGNRKSLPVINKSNRTNL